MPDPDPSHPIQDTGHSLGERQGTDKIPLYLPLKRGDWKMKSLLVIRFSKNSFFTETGCNLNSISAILPDEKIPARYDSFYNKIVES